MLTSAALTSAALASDFCRSRILSRLRLLHHDERGTISILTVVTIIGLMILLGMVTNAARQVDDKIKMQNAVDAGAYSGGVVLARGMNALAFSNHLLCDVFALTAFMREARDRNAESMVPDVLAAWSTVGDIFGRAQFEKFRKLGPAIKGKVPLEQKAVSTYSDMSAATAQHVLPVLEYVLRERLIPEYQRALVQQIPPLAQRTTDQIVRRHGTHRFNPGRVDRERGPQVGVLWRTRAQAVGVPDERDPLARTLPVVDPTSPSASQREPIPDPHPDSLEGADAQYLGSLAAYQAEARAMRESLARHDLEQWTADRLRFFEIEGRMSQFINLWRVFTCGQLMKLLHEEYPHSNLPHILRLTEDGTRAETLRLSRNSSAINSYLDRNFMFVGVAYRKKFTETFPGFFRNPLGSDSLTFAQISLFIPRGRMRLSLGGQSGGGSTNIGGGGIGVDTPIPMEQPVTSSPPGWHGENWPPEWTLFNQNWTVQLVPATSDSLAQILQTQPPPEALSQPISIRLPKLDGTTSTDLHRINNH